MATTDEISAQVDLLADAYGKRLASDGSGYEVYRIALHDIDGDHIRRGVTTLIRERLQFMPSPAEVRCFAMAEKSADNRQQDNTADNIRITCLKCMDTGAVSIVSPRWLAEHRDKLNAEWLAPGWMRTGHLWCVHNHRGGLLVTVVCDCECRNATLYREQLDKSKGVEDKKGSTYPGVLRRIDCVVASVGEPTVRAAVLAWSEVDRDTRPWSGNWVP